ncbi:NAD(P)/FAD-dependent oxidoreductase [Leeuwenhoekiella parthenopeia]|uniref:NAD(P)/FAD-dependent oxidoreductase n=1 Tax=Leeuwenhoekiella parthenopeia TaxID=2890320 RepID=A0ABS8GSY8_9FLAO|nr:NAD(P)/FAD-dependent oxidoreductase [Leeuwenhoekiella parthenopeia]MCC4212921.1 NAD(P)/FAD-dependent oxidoreductase [Leeuwenhoekiella parthenopeia]
MKVDVLVLGGGAAGFFSAINCSQLSPDLSVAILERGAEVLEKVRISGGGRCNLTHAVFEPKPLTEYYPRGKRELLGPFHSFMTGDTMQWFENLGVDLKIEDDGRVFPVSNSSQTVIDCFLNQAEQLGIAIFKKATVLKIEKQGLLWRVTTKNQSFEARVVIVATGSNPKILQMLGVMGFDIVPQVPSLFTFNITDTRIKDLAGLSTDAVVSLLDLDEKYLDIENSAVGKEGARGPVLVTHWGLSGPGILKLSAWGARSLKNLNYEFKIKINWLPDFSKQQVFDLLNRYRLKLAKQNLFKYTPFNLPKRLWQRLMTAAGISETQKWADLTSAEISALSEQLCSGIFRVSGKSTFKEEFVTAGGVDLKEVDFRTYESKKFEGLYLVGEVLNIDAVTGGFNFQNAWTGGFIAARDIAGKLVDVETS